jgi:hypothetical protein
MSRWRKHTERLRRWGLLRSVGYYALGIPADKAGIKYLAAFEYHKTSLADSSLSGATFSILKSPQDWTPRDLEQLRVLYSPAQLALFDRLFSRKDMCVVAHVESDELACLCWVQSTANYLFCQGAPGFLIHSCYTVPRHRGQGLYRRALVFACEHLIREVPNARVFVECSIFNHASSQGILNAGFSPVGRIAKVRNWQRGWRIDSAVPSAAIVQ